MSDNVAFLILLLPVILEGFPPIAGPDAHTLILGSMPGEASLAAGCYYANPRNAFWTIVGEVLDIDPGQPYPQRVDQLAAKGFALWDVLGACRRKGSLDTRIEPQSIQVNPFMPFLIEHPHVERIFFNGAMAERIFVRRVVPLLAPDGRPRLHRLPSTSPAHASLSLARKLAAWRAIAR
ncbi:DNA-deoxyinosine glycosylase [Rhodocyclaceae bacterium SMB388]